MGHRLSQRVYMAKCYVEKEAIYAELAKQLATKKKLTIFYREKVRIEYKIKRNKLVSYIFNSNGEKCGGNISFYFKVKSDNYLKAMRFNFARDEAQAREIYNYDVRRLKMNL